MMIRLCTLLVALGVMMTAGASAQLSNVTFLHNSPDPSLSTIDLYVTQAGNTVKFEDIEFQAANNLDGIAIFDDLEVTFAIALGNSSDASNPVATYSLLPTQEKAYMAIFRGVREATGFVANPDGQNITLNLQIFEVTRQIADPVKAGLYFVHGATDLEIGDLYIRGRAQAATTSLKYGMNTAQPLLLDRDRITIDYTKAGDKTRVTGSFEVDLGVMAGQVIVVTLSGFKTPGDNHNSMDTLSMLAVLENGSVVKCPLIAGSQTARVQFVHNSPDPAVSVMDVWINTVKNASMDNFAYRKATGFTNLAAGQPLVIGFAPATATSYRDTIKTVTLPALRAGRTYTIVMQGVVDTTKFPANPDGRDLNLTALIVDNALEASNEGGKTTLRIVNNSPNAPEIDVITRTDTTLLTGARYGDFMPAYRGIEPRVDTLWVRDANNKILRGWVADLRGTNRAALALASGMFDLTSAAPSSTFKIILVDPNGTVNASLLEVAAPDTSTSVAEEGMVPASAWTVSPVPASGDVTLSVAASLAGPARFDVYDATGMFVGSWIATGADAASAVIPGSTLATGTYLVRATMPDGRTIGTTRFVISR